MGKNDITIRNPFQYVAEKIDNARGSGALVVSSALIAFVSAIGAEIATKNSFETPDTKGNVEQAQLVREFEQRILQLKEKDFAAEKAAAALEFAEQYENEDTTQAKQLELLQAQSDFSKMRGKFFSDLYFKHADETGAGLSEKNIKEIYKKATANFDAGSFSTTSDFSMVDETISDMAKAGEIDLKDYRAIDAKNLQKKLADIDESRVVAQTAASLFAFVLMFGSFAGAQIAFASKFKDKPKRITIKKAKKRLPSNS